MRIEISAGGIGCGTSIMEFSSVFDGFLSNTDSVISCFKTIKNETYSLSGGAGNLQTALDNLESRVRTEEALKESAVLAKAKSDSFLSLAQRIDNQVASDVKKNRNEFYSVNSWAKPTTSNEEKKWYEKAWNWLCDKAEGIKEGFLNIGDSIRKAWASIVDFYHKHENLCKIMIGVAAIAIAVVVTFATGGAAMAIPALLAMTKAAIMSGLVSAAIAGSISAISTLAHGDSLQIAVENTIHSAINGFCSGFMWGGIFAGTTQVVSVAKARNAMTQAQRLSMSRITGKQFAEEQFHKFSKTNTQAAQEITVKTPGGIRTRLDQIGIDSKGKIIINEIKSSPTAPLTSNQSLAFPEILEKGAVVKGLGKGIFTDGFVIPPGTEVKIIRSSFRFVNFKELFKLPAILGGLFGGGETVLTSN